MPMPSRRILPLPMLLLPALLLPLLLGACAEEGPPADRAYDVRGRVVERTGPLGARIDHEAIPGLMEAMTMPFVARDSTQLQGVVAGDSVQFRYVVTPRGQWIEGVRVIGGAPADL